MKWKKKMKRKKKWTKQKVVKKREKSWWDHEMNINNNKRLNNNKTISSVLFLMRRIEPLVRLCLWFVSLFSILPSFEYLYYQNVIQTHRKNASEKQFHYSTMLFFVCFMVVRAVEIFFSFYLFSFCTMKMEKREQFFWKSYFGVGWKAGYKTEKERWTSKEPNKCKINTYNALCLQ